MAEKKATKKSAKKQEPEKLHVQVTASLLNVRKDPSLQSDVVGMLEKGTELDVLQEKEGWYLTATGWVMARFCEPA